MAWTYKYRNTHIVVKASQPIFCVILSIGCLAQVLSIIPLSIQGGNHVLQPHANTLLSTEEPNPQLPSLDFTCMAGPWLYFFIGEATIFSALFAKILRIKKYMNQAWPSGG